MEQDWVFLCQALYQAIGMGLERRARNVERGLAEHWCEESWHQVAGLGKRSYKKEGGEVFFSASDEQVREPSKEGRHCVKLVRSLERGHAQAFRICEGETGRWARQRSHVSWETV